jgi:hypothetical protein
MSVPAAVVCEPQVPTCCEGAPVFYGQGETFLNAQTGFLLTCPPGFSCDAGFYPHPIIVPHGTIPFTPPTGANPLRATCCDGSIAVRYLPDGFTQAQFDTAAQSIVDEMATKLAGCMAADYNAEHAQRRTNCIITTSSPLTPASVGVPYAVQLQQTGVIGDVVWAVTSGVLPSGFSLSTDGLLSGTTMIGGAFSFVVQATHDNGSCKRVFSITISSDVPCDLGLDDNTVIGDRSVNTGLAASTAQWAGVTLGSYKIGYVSGAANIDDGNPGGTWYVNPPAATGPCSGNAKYTYTAFFSTTTKKLPYSFINESSLGAAEANFNASNPSAVCTGDEFLFPAPDGRETQVSPISGGNIDVTVNDDIGLGSAGLTTFRLTRTRKAAIDYGIQLRVIDLASLLASLTPFDSCTAGGVATVWDGTFPLFVPTFNYANYEYDASASFGTLQLNSCLLATPGLLKVYHDNAGQATPTGCAWILAISYVHPVQGEVVSWVGLGGNGYSPVGTYVFASDIVGWTMFGLKTAVRAATTAALPANTRTLNVLTASANGALPAIDGVALALADRVLVKNEALAANNGVYVVTDAGSGITPWILTRSTDLDTSAEMLRGVFMPVTAGITLAGQHFRLVTNGVITLNTTALSFTAIAPTIEAEEY